MNRWRPLVLLWLAGLLFAAPAAHGLELSGEPIQGGLMIGRTVPGARVQLDDRPVRVDDRGRFLIGFGRDHPARARLTVRRPDRTVETREIAVAQRRYREQRIDGLPPKTVTPDPEVLARIRAEAAAVRAARSHDAPRSDWAGGFAWPARGPISGVYGSRRILNGEPRRPHYGVDIALPAGTPVRAPAAGIVRLAETLYFSGNTVILDHGHGLTSSYLHLERIDVAEGALVEAGTVIGTIGATGRATGPHLDWRFNWFDQRLDAALVAGPME